MLKNEAGECLVQHHIEYEELHGQDKVVMITMSEHVKLHRRLRRDGKCNVPPDILKQISIAASSRTDNQNEYEKRNRFSFDFRDSMIPFVRHSEQIRYNISTGSVGVNCRFMGSHGKKLFHIDIN